ncbi:MAG: hypothetical protein ACPG5B_03615 [Chitinophagales bacterium]
MSNFLTILVILGWASTKYAVALGLIFYNDFNFIESISLAILGGMIGVFFFSFFGDAIIKLKNYLFKTEKKAFTVNRRTRFLVKVRRRYGLAGIAFLTPLFLTVPVGTMVASSLYRKNRLKVYSYMFIAFAFWSVVLCGAYSWFGFDFYEVLHQLV